MRNAYKKKIKELVNSLCMATVFPLFVFYCILGGIGNKERLFWSFSQLFSLIPGVSGNYLRKSFYRLTMSRCSKDCAILFGTIFSQTDTEIGRGVYIGPNCNIGRCRIEDHCTLGSNVHIMSGKRQHKFDDLDTPIQEQGGVFKKVIIGEDAWIGNCAVVMANVGKKCIVGAGSVVTKDVVDYSIVAGNPARMIKKRI